MRKKAELFKPVVYVLTATLLAITAVIGFWDYMLFRYVVPVIAVVFAYVIFRMKFVRDSIDKFVYNIGDAIAQVHENNIMEFPMPVIICRNTGEVVWFNQNLKQLCPDNQELYGKQVTELLPEFDYKEVTSDKPHNVSAFGKRFSVYVVKTIQDEEELFSLYLVDDTELKKYYVEYFKTKPVVMIAVIDNYDEIIQNAKEGERTQVVSNIEYAIMHFAKESDSLLCRIERDKFMMIVEEQNFKKIVENKFSVLDAVRNITVGERMNATLSIGASRDGKDLREMERLARQALDMSLGRGGDQAALKTQNGYDFYGGVSKGVEKRTKVKTRIVATALMELIDSCENVIIMGHRFADLDSFGSAVGLSKAVAQRQKPVHIAIRAKKHLVSPLYEKLEENGYGEIFAEPEVLLNEVSANTLLIVVDTHVEKILESAELYRACKHVVVIDHHRKMVGHIDNAVIFYHEPYASSASEMVAELVQYFEDNGKLGRMEAEAMLAGIMLDTKNFIIKTGVRTFEAAAFLKKMGADTVDVKKLFSASIETYQHRSNLVASAEIYKGCAIATTDSTSTDIKIVVPQAADELLTIVGVDASFVMYESNGEIVFSARSMGKINVQIIMEKLGGGGHLTMAGAQVKNISIAEAKEQLLVAINEFFNE